VSALGEDCGELWISPASQHEPCSIGGLENSTDLMIWDPSSANRQRLGIWLGRFDAALEVSAVLGY